MSQERYYEDRDRRSPRPPEERERTAPRRRKKRQSSAGRTAALVLLYVVAVIGASILLACVGWVAAGDVLALNKPDKEVTITIAPDTSFDDVTNRLKEEGLIEYKLLFKLFAAFTHGADKVTMGTYTLNTDMDYRALLYGMSANSATKAEVSVTITEGMTTAQIFQELERMGVASRSELERVASEHDYAFSFLQDIPLGDYHRLEGYLMPDTYTFYTPHDPIYALNKFLVYFDSQVDDSIRTKAADSGYSLREILTIASMIERETTGEDRTDIASVIYNRLENPSAETVGYLQVDATLVYLNGGKVPTLADRTIDSPYNTYLYQGLPAGPISNPGMRSLLAAMNPDDTNYFFYVLNPETKRHEFSRTYAEHDALVQRYQGNGG